MLDLILKPLKNASPYEDVGWSWKDRYFRAAAAALMVCSRQELNLDQEKEDEYSLLPLGNIRFLPAQQTNNKYIQGSSFLC